MTMCRRSFLGTAPAALAAGLVDLSRPAQVAAAPSQGAEAVRKQQAFQIRVNAAQLARRRPETAHVSNGEEALYANKIASYSKGLPHNSLGEVDPTAYGALLRAIESGDPDGFEAIPLGLGRRLTNPQAGLAFDLEGADSHHLFISPAPTIASAQGAADLVELYWMALARDVDFRNYDTDPIIAAAAQDLSSLSDLRGPRAAGRVTPATIFRGNTAGDLIGPYVSQFLWLDIPMGAMRIPQRMHTVAPGVDYMTSYGEWLAIQDGLVPDPGAFDAVPTYIRNLRDLCEWVHVDALYQAYHQACLILLGMQAPFDSGNPYERMRNQIGFATFGGPHILSLVTEVATRALKAVWYQKWFVHRRLRPEAFGGLIHHSLSGSASYPVHPEVRASAALARAKARYGTYLLPMAAPEGCPTHPSYGSGHATVAGACVTILKAWFDESFPLSGAVVPDASGTMLVPYQGPLLTVGNELDKLAANVAFGRNALGFHYRSDYFHSLRLGEAVALSVLEEQKATYSEEATFTLTTFDGTSVTI